MTDETTTAAANPAPTPIAAVPAHIIPAALPHPNTSGPLARGLTYLHHFEAAKVAPPVNPAGATTTLGNPTTAGT